MTPHAGRRLLLALVALACLIAVPVAAAGPPDVEDLDEAKLRTFEERVLGPGHAAEHARARKKHGKKAPTGRAARHLHPRGASTRIARRPRAHRAAVPAEDGRWSDPVDLPINAIHAALMPTGKVLFWAYPNRGLNAKSNRSEAWIWDPRTNATKQADPPLLFDQEDQAWKPANLWCSGQSLLADGRVLVTGGNLEYFKYGRNDYKGLNRVYTFNSFTEKWIEQPQMRHGRWYPSQAILEDGRTVIMGGYDETGGGYSTRNVDIELFTPAADMAARGTVSLLGGRRDGSAGNPPDGGFYPHMFGLPSGRTMVLGPEPQDSWLLHDPGTSNLFGWTDVPDLPSFRRFAPAVNLPGGASGSSRVAIMGGADEAFPSPSLTKSTDTFDEAKATMGWVPGGSQQVARAHHNVVLTPDGGMVSLGGGLGEVSKGDLWAWDREQLTTEIWDRTTSRWRLGAAQTVPRTYHSTALLLPDGRIMSAGDDGNSPNRRATAEVYEPPYLHKGARPTVTNAPTHLDWNAPFTVSTANTNIKRAVLMAPGAVTHGADMAQRYVPLRGLARRADGKGYDVRSPASGKVAAPGYYMLFLVNDKGVPSVARWVQVGQGVTAPEEGSPPEHGEPPVDKALGRPATASSSYDSASVPDRANDGNLTTRWDSAQGRDRGWWQVDLGAERQVDRVRVNWEDAYASRYTIATSTNGTTFTKAAEVALTRREDHTVTFPARTARYLRITGLERGTQYGISFWDVNVHGPDDDAPPAPPPIDKALDRPATASTSYDGATTPEKANDGNLSTRWDSEQAADGQWWQVDLGGERLVGGVSVNWEDAYASRYEVRTSTDGRNFTTAATVGLTGPGVRDSDFAVRRARYVRIAGIERATQYGISFWDVKVFGPED